MSVTMHVEYLGGLRCRATHGPSGNVLLTDAPVDNHGRGEAFSPTDLVATALATCVLTVTGIVAERDGIPWTGASATVVKEMAAAPLRRIAALTVRVTFPAGAAAAIAPAQRKKLEKTAATCPVHESLHPETKVSVEFVWE